MNRTELTLGIASFVVSLMGAVWCGVQGTAMAMSYGAGAGGNSVPSQHISPTVFPLPVLAAILAASVLASARRRGNLRPSLWTAVPALAISLLTIAAALSAL